MILHALYIAACELQAASARRTALHIGSDGALAATQLAGDIASNDRLCGEFVIVSIEAAKPGGVAEIAALRMVAGMKPAAEFHARVKAESELKEALQQLAAFVNQHPLFAYDAFATRQLLQRAARQHGLSFSYPIYDSLLVFWRAWPGLPSYQLAELAELLGLACQAEPDALDTAHTTLALLRAACQPAGSASLRPAGHVQAGLAGGNVAQSG